VIDNQNSVPDVMYVELHYHPQEWTNGETPAVYKFRVTGKTWGTSRWVVHAVYADRPAPASGRHNMGALRALLTQELSHRLGRDISDWENGLLAWEDA
jgi:hypothetical protein